MPCWSGSALGCADPNNTDASLAAQEGTGYDFESHLRSERFRRLLPYIEMSVEPPVVSFGSIEHIRGIEFLVDVLSSKTR